MNTFTILSLFWLIIPMGPSEGTVTRSSFLGISLNTTTFEDADRILRDRSFQEPKKYFKSIRFSDGTSSTLNLPIYFVRIGHSELKVTLKGYASVGQIHIENMRSKGEVKYEDVVLGTTRVSDIKLDNDKDWRETKDIDGKVQLTNRYKGIKIGIDPNSSDDITNRIVTLFVLQATERDE